MKTVAGNQRLLRRNGTYYYRRRVPLHLVKAIGKKFIVLSLDTTSVKQAKQPRAVKDLEWDAQFAAGEAFTLEQIKQFFGSKFYTDCAQYAVPFAQDKK